MEVIFATRNKGKFEEARRKLEEVGMVQDISQGS